MLPSDVPSLIKFFIDLDNFPSVRRYYRAFPTNSPSLLIRTMIELGKYVAPILRRNYIMYVALDAGDIAGVCHIEVRDDTATYGIVVHPRYWGRGVGRALSAVTIDEVRERVKRVLLTVDEDNARAISLYKRLGFRVVGRVPECVSREGGVVGCLVAVLKLNG